LQVRSIEIPLAARFLAALILSLTNVVTASAASPGSISAQGLPDLGPNVSIFDPSMPVSQIQETLDAIHAQQVDAEMSTNR
jgi:hypothetical protein